MAKNLLDIGVNATVTQIPKKQTCGTYTLSIYHNNHIDIPPHKDERAEESINECKEKVDIIYETVELSNSKIIQTDTMDENFDKVCQSQLEDIKFELKILSMEEQFEEIENKKKSERYRRMSFRCDKCGIGFLTNDVYQEHLKRHDSTAGPYTCNICTLRFKSRLVSSQHALAHRRRFICRECGTTVSRWSLAVGHRCECGQPPQLVVCSLCPKIFSNDQSLYKHIRAVHRNEKKYVCEECDNTFTTKQRLRVHIRSHTGDKPFPCEICGKRFTTASNLRSHTNVHLTSKIYQCVECNTMYKTDRSLKKHFVESIKHMKDSNRRFSCDLCSKKFLSETTLRSHTKIRHMTKYSCDVCNKNFSSSSNLRKHARSIHAIISE